MCYTLSVDKITIGVQKARNVIAWLQKWLVEPQNTAKTLAFLMVGSTIWLMVLVLFVDWDFFYTSHDANVKFYLLSSIVQSLASVLAVLITLSLVATQLAAASYTRGLIEQRRKDPWLWSATAIYLTAIIWSLVALAAVGSDSPFKSIANEKGINIALLLALLALAYVVPFSLASLENLQPRKIAASLIRKRDYNSLDEFLRRAISRGIMSLFEPVLNEFALNIETQLTSSKGSAQTANETREVLLSIGRYACQQRNPDAVVAVMRHITELVATCGGRPPQVWRAAADVFNEAVKQLYFYSEAWIGSPQASSISADYSQICLDAGANFHEIAKVKAEEREDNLRLAPSRLTRWPCLSTNARSLHANTPQPITTSAELTHAWRMFGTKRRT